MLTAADDGRPPDLRMPLLGAAAWAGAHPRLAGRCPGPPALASAVAVLVLALRRRRCGGVRGGRSLAAAVRWCCSPPRVVAGLRAHQVAHNPVAELAARAGRRLGRRHGHLRPACCSTAGRTDQVMWRLRVSEVPGRGTDARPWSRRCWSSRRRRRARGPPWAPPSGSRGRLAPADDGDLAAAARRERRARGASRPPTSGGAAPAAVRQSLRDSVAHRPPTQRALVPALVDGDDAGADPDDVADGLPHDRADPPARGLGHQPHPGGRVPAGAGPLVPGARARGWCVVGAAGVVGFVLLARTEPSVLRAAVMGTVGAGRARPRRAPAGPAGARRRGAGPAAGRPVAGGRRPASRCRCWPPPASWCSPRAGATRWPAGCRAGWPRRSRSRWPRSSPARRWSPAISGQVSLVAVVANLLAAPGGRAGDGARAGRRAARAGRPGPVGPAAGTLAGVVRRLDHRGRRARRRAARGGRRLGDRRRRRWRC